jgi:MFS family permease
MDWEQCRLVLYAVLVVSLSHGVYQSLGLFYFPDSERLNFSILVLANVFTSHVVAAAFVALLAGYLCDRFGMLPVLIFGFVTFVLSLACLSLVHTLAPVWILFVANGIGLGCLATVAFVSFCKFSRRRYFGREFIAYSLLLEMGQIAVRFMTKALVDHFDWRVAIAVLSLVVLVVLGMLVWLFGKMLRNFGQKASDPAADRETGLDLSKLHWVLAAFVALAFLCSAGDSSLTRYVDFVERDTGSWGALSNDSPQIHWALFLGWGVGAVVADMARDLGRIVFPAIVIAGISALTMSLLPNTQMVIIAVLFVVAGMALGVSTVPLLKSYICRVPVHQLCLLVAAFIFFQKAGKLAGTYISSSFIGYGNVAPVAYSAFALFLLASLLAWRLRPNLDAINLGTKLKI